MFLCKENFFGKFFFLPMNIGIHFPILSPYLFFSLPFKLRKEWGDADTERYAAYDGKQVKDLLFSSLSPLCKNTSLSFLASMPSRICLRPFLTMSVFWVSRTWMEGGGTKHKKNFFAFLHETERACFDINF